MTSFASSPLDLFLVKLLSLRIYLPQRLQPKALAENHNERDRIIGIIRTLSGSGYPKYTPAMRKAAGLPAPLPGFTHADLLDSVARVVQGVLLQRGIAESAIDRIAMVMTQSLQPTLEAHAIEYQLSNFFHRDYPCRILKTHTLFELADIYGEKIYRAMVDVMYSNPACLYGMHPLVRQDLCDEVCNSVRNHILQLLYR